MSEYIENDDAMIADHVAQFSVSEFARFAAFVPVLRGILEDAGYEIVQGEMDSDEPDHEVFHGRHWAIYTGRDGKAEYSDPRDSELAALLDAVRHLAQRKEAP